MILNQKNGKWGFLSGLCNNQALILLPTIRLFDYVSISFYLS